MGSIILNRDLFEFRAYGIIQCLHNLAWGITVKFDGNSDQILFINMVK